MPGPGAKDRGKKTEATMECFSWLLDMHSSQPHKISPVPAIAMYSGNPSQYCEMNETQVNDTLGSTKSGSSSEGCDLNIALTACDLESVPSYIRKISGLGARLAEGDLQTRLSILKLARDLVVALETPRETMIKHCWAEPASFTAIETGIQIGLFRALSRGNGSSKKSTDLAQELGVDQLLVARLLRHLGAMGYVKETGADEYKPTNFSTSLTIPAISGVYPLMSVGFVDKLPKFLERNGYNAPTSATNSPYQYAHNTKLNMLEHLELDPANFERFHNFMGVYRQGRASWMDDGFFPVQERLVNDADYHDGAAFLVDIGGSLGHDLEEFHRKHPKVPGRLILQDLSSVLGQIQHLDERVERMAYDFYTEQPVKGSRAYFMHSVLHDWPDGVCQKILARVTEAMKPGYSKLLVNENVIPVTGADWQATAEDMMVMITSSALERTEVHWRYLLKGAGLRVLNIWSVENGLECLIECELS